MKDVPRITYKYRRSEKASVDRKIASQMYAIDIMKELVERYVSANVKWSAAHVKHESKQKLKKSGLNHTESKKTRQIKRMVQSPNFSGIPRRHARPRRIVRRIIQNRPEGTEGLVGISESPESIIVLLWAVGRI